MLHWGLLEGAVVLLVSNRAVRPGLCLPPLDPATPGSRAVGHVVPWSVVLSVDYSLELGCSQSDRQRTAELSKGAPSQCTANVL